MKRIKTIALLVLIGLFSMPSWCIAATANDGNQLLVDCTAGIIVAEGGHLSDKTRLVDASRCLGFLQGIVRMNNFYREKGDSLFCLPKGSTYGQYARIVVKYLQDHPEELHQDEFDLAVGALVIAFPCTNKK